jgi:hypothetical protein
MAYNIKDMGGSVLNNYRWQNRILMVLTDDETIASRQKEILDQDIDGVLDRDLVVFGLGGEGAPYLEDTDVDLDRVRDGFSLEDDDKIVLLGKDGSVKGKWGAPVTTEELFTLIDAMPMRKEEMRRKKMRKS